MKSLLRSLTLLLLALPALAQAAPAQKVSDQSFLDIQVKDSAAQGRWRIRVADLDAPLKLDSNGDGKISWPEIADRQSDIEDYLREHLRLSSGGKDLALHFDQLLYGSQQGEDFLLSNWSITASETITTLDLDYDLLFDLNPEHRCELLITWPGQRQNKLSLGADQPQRHFSAAEATEKGFVHFLGQGIWHIWIGYDHILFLIVLLIPAVFRRTPTGREPVPTFGGALARVVTIVSSFTVAHSITLTCAVMQWIVLPGRLVESAIAASVFLAALHNFLPTTAGGRGAWLAFAFGLLHGFGFAGALGELEQGSAPLWQTLIAFNVGVEMGQLAIVAVFLPIAFSLRHTRLYRVGVISGGSSLACLFSLVWFWQRAFL